MIVPDRIGHVVIKVRDIERSRDFYTDVMGLTVMMEVPKMKMAFFASHGRDHHELACVEVGADAPGPQKGEIGLVHIAFRLRDEEHLRAAYRELKEKHVPIVSTVDHGITKSIYFRDPDAISSRSTATTRRNISRVCPNRTPAWTSSISRRTNPA
jgi:catechol 2,3-dioxygenase